MRVQKRTVIPANSVMRLQCVLDEDMADYMVEPKANTKLFSARTMHRGGDQPKVCLINLGDHHIVMQRKQVVGTELEVEELLDENNLPVINRVDRDEDNLPVACGQD